MLLTTRHSVTLGVTHSTHLDQYMTTRIPHYGIIQNSFTALKIFRGPPMHPPSP